MSTASGSAHSRLPSRRRWAVGVLVLVGILGLPTVGLVATDHLLRQANERQAKDSNALAATAVASEVAQSYGQRQLVLRNMSHSPSLVRGLTTGARSLLTEALKSALDDGQFCRLVLRSPGIAPVSVSGPGTCWAPPAPATAANGTRSLGTAVVRSAGFTGLESSGLIPGQPAASLQAVFSVGSLVAPIMPGEGNHATLVSGLTIAASSDPTVMGKQIAAPQARALVRAGRPATDILYSPLRHTEVITAFHPVPGTDLGVFFSVTTKVAYATADHVSRLLFYGYLALMALGLGLAALVVVLLRRRDQASQRAVRALAESEDRFRQAFEHAPIGKALVGLDGRFQQVNPAMCTLTGYSAAELGELTVADVTHPDDLAADEAATDSLLAGERATYTIEKRYLTSAGDMVWASNSASLVRAADGAPLHVIAQVQDITERKHHEQILARERSRLSDAEAIGRTGSWEIDLATHEVIWSDSLLALYGINAATFRGQYPAGVLPRIHPDDRAQVDAAVRSCADTGAPLQVRHRVIRADDGELRWFDASGERAGGHLVGAVVDVTDHVRAAQMLQEARDLALEASRQKSTFLATMSHEIRTPMNAVIGMTGLLQDTPLNQEQREFVETVRTSGYALLAVINDILDFSKIEAGGLQLEQLPLDLRECVESSLELVAAISADKRLELVSHLDIRCPTRVVGDANRLRQVIVNLLSNAVKFTAAGEVVLRVEPAEHDGQPGLRFAVSDTGIGIPADRLSHLFEPFSQVDASTTRVFGGTGLGLAISRRLVGAMGGTLAVDSVVGRGSTFHFSIALAPTGLGAAPTLSALAGTSEHRSVLVVDDNATARRMLRVQLASWGLAVTEAASGAAAVAVLASGEVFDVAVVDLQMPGMTGEELAVALTSSAGTRDLPLVLLATSTAGRQTLRRPELFAAVLPKPVRAGRLHHTLRDVLGADGSSSALASPPTPGQATVGAALRVLLAEDNVVNQRVGRLMIERLGHRVDVVANGQEAREAVQAAPYDIVLMDIEMPEMDGLAATRAIRRELPASGQPRIVALTASALLEDRRACNEAGMDDYLAKPVRLQELGAVLATSPPAGPRRPLRVAP